MFSLSVPDVQTPFQSGNDTYVDVGTNLNSFNRQNQQVGPADLPGLSKAPSDVGQSSQSSVAPELPVHSINGDAAYEIVEVLAKRKTRFGPKNKPKHGYDYRVRWKSDGNTHYPDSWVPQSDIKARNLIQDFERRQKVQTSTTSAPAPAVAPAQASSVPTGPTVIPGLCNYVYVAFLAVLSGCSITNSNQSWKNIKVPDNRAEMLRSPEREFWLQAEREELKGIEDMKTWTRVNKPKKKPITCRWVYKLKPPTSVQPNPIFKCRLVVHGYKQQAEVDFTNTFAQVATMKAFRILLWLGALVGLTATQLDIKQAFLYGKVDKEIYLSGVPGYDHIGCVKLERSLYGIRQAPKIWYDTLISEFHNLGFVELISDTCVFKHPTEQCYLLIFVDDILIVTKNENFRQQVVTHLESKFKLKDMGLLRHFIGLQVDYDEDGTTHIHQGDYAEKICDTFDDNDSTRRTPYEDNQKFSTTQQPASDSDKREMSSYPYRQLIGSLLYLLCTRPELYFVVVSLSRFVSNPGLAHWLAALAVLRYVKFTTVVGIIIKPFQKLELSVYCDSDWGSNTDDRKSISGYIIYLGSTPIIWRSRTQKGKAAQHLLARRSIAL